MCTISLFLWSPPIKRRAVRTVKIDEKRKRYYINPFILKSCGSSVTCHWRPALTEVGHASTDGKARRRKKTETIVEEEDLQRRRRQWGARIPSRVFLAKRTVVDHVVYSAVSYGTEHSWVLNTLNIRVCWTFVVIALFELLPLRDWLITLTLLRDVCLCLALGVHAHFSLLNNVNTYVHICILMLE